MALIDLLCGPSVEVAVLCALAVMAADVDVVGIRDEVLETVVVMVIDVVAIEVRLGDVVVVAVDKFDREIVAKDESERVDVSVATALVLGERVAVLKGGRVRDVVDDGDCEALGLSEVLGVGLRVTLGEGTAVLVDESDLEGVEGHVAVGDRLVLLVRVAEGLKLIVLVRGIVEDVENVSEAEWLLEADRDTLAETVAETVVVVDAEREAPIDTLLDIVAERLAVGDSDGDLVREAELEFEAQEETLNVTDPEGVGRRVSDGETEIVNVAVGDPLAELEALQVGVVLSLLDVDMLRVIVALSDRVTEGVSVQLVELDDVFEKERVGEVVFDIKSVNVVVVLVVVLWLRVGVGDALRDIVSLLELVVEDDAVTVTLSDLVALCVTVPVEECVAVELRDVLRVTEPVNEQFPESETVSVRDTVWDTKCECETVPVNVDEPV